jgi:ABC-type multidrug transport system ATPase subunit
MNAPALGAMLCVRDLVFAYPGHPLFDGFNGVFGGGLTWVQGANGSGKSTLLKLLAGALEPRSGTLEVLGIDAAQEPLAYRRNIFWCGPDALPFEHLLAAEYFGFLQGLYPNFDSDAVADHLAGFRLREQMAVPIGKMSTGTRRKVWLTAALAVGCATVLLDEPMNALDGNSSLYLRQRLNRAAMQRERCWIVASHVEPCQDVSALNTLTLR